MNWDVVRKPSRWTLPAVAFAAGLAAAHLPALRLAAPAQAASGLSPVERLLAEDDIRQKIALYGLYADGSGAEGPPRDLRALADTLMTPDVVSEIHRAGGGPPLILNGRDVVAKSPPENDPDKAKQIAGRHYLVASVFDDISPTAAHTRTTAVYFDASKGMGEGCSVAGQSACTGQPIKTIMWVYQMTWKKTAQGWQISRNVLRDDN